MTYYVCIVKDKSVYSDYPRDHSERRETKIFVASSKEEMINLLVSFNYVNDIADITETPRVYEIGNIMVVSEDIPISSIDFSKHFYYEGFEERKENYRQTEEIKNITKFIRKQQSLEEENERKEYERLKKKFGND